MKSVRTEGCHVGLFREFVGTACCTYGQSNTTSDLNREILASNLFNCRKEVINVPPVPSISRCIHIVYRHKNVWEYQWSNFIYNCMSTFLHYVHCKDALLDCSAPGGERCESLTWVDEIMWSEIVGLKTRPWRLCFTPDIVDWHKTLGKSINHTSIYFSQVLGDFELSFESEQH